MVQAYDAHDVRAYAGDDEVSAPAGTFTTLAQFAGGLISLGLIVGIGIWGYKLVVRDVSGIPVVRAVEGDMRVRPEDPGGQLAEHQGLAVNAVAADGAAEGPVDQVVLAPPPIDLEAEDQPPQTAATEPVVAPAPLDLEEAIRTNDIDTIVARITDGVATIEPGDDAQSAPVLVSLAVPETDDVAETEVVAAAQAVLRPRVRPLRSATAVPVAALVEDIAPESISAGTRLVQLGAYDTIDMAKEEWDKIAGKFGTFLKGKGRVLQEAQSGGRSFYRLRAHGFADLSDARRFCSALVAEGAECIPVVSR